MKADKIGGIDRWEVESASRALMEAGRVRRDPKMMKAVAELEAERELEIRSIKDLKRVRSKKLQEMRKAQA